MARENCLDFHGGLSTNYVSLQEGRRVYGNGTFGVGTFCLCLDHPIVEVSNLDIVHIKPSKNVPVWGLINFSNIKLKWIVEVPECHGIEKRLC